MDITLTGQLPTNIPPRTVQRLKMVVMAQGLLKSYEQKCGKGS